MAQLRHAARLVLVCWSVAMCAHTVAAASPDDAAGTSVSVTLPTGVVQLVVQPGESIATAVARFSEQYGVGAGDAPMLEAALQNELTRRSTPSELPAVRVVVFVDVGSGGSHPLVVRDGQAPEDAALAFLRTHNLPERNVPALVNAVNRKLAARAAGPPVLALSVTVDSQQLVARLYEDEDPVAAAREFLFFNGLEAHPRAAEYQADIQAALADELQKRAPPSLSPEEQRRQQEAAAAEARAAMAANKAAEQQAVPHEPEFREMRLTVAGMAYDLEYPVGEPAEVLAEAFCDQEFDLLKPQLGHDLSVVDCTHLVSGLMQSQLGDAE